MLASRIVGGFFVGLASAFITEHLGFASWETFGTSGCLALAAVFLTALKD